MQHVRYDDWTDLIDRVIARFSASPRPRIYEIGGGTGVLASYLLRKGYRYIGSDLSYEMCRVAGEKGMPFIAADARHLPVKARFDLAVFLYDGINYLWELSEYERVFDEVSRTLMPGGLFLFDITTTANSLTNFRDYLDCEDYGDYYYVRHSFFDTSVQAQYNDFTIFRKIDSRECLFERTEEHHAQRIFPVTAIVKRVPHEFEVLGIWDGFSFRKYSRNSERVHFLLRKRKRHT